MKTLIKVVVLFFFTLNIHAQDAKKAKQLLDDVAAKAKTYTNIVIDFKYSLSNLKSLSSTAWKLR